ncbi:MAG: hypothetical protein WCQ54_10405 [Clostridiaceae bacterium]
MGNLLFKNKQGLTEEDFFKLYDADIYKKPSFSVDMLIFTVTDEEKNKLPEASGKNAENTFS